MLAYGVKLLFKVSVLGVLFVYLFSGCASTSTLQTARTVPVNEWRFVGSAALVESNTLGKAVTVIKSNTGSKASLYSRYPVLEAMIRHGYSENMDWGLRYTTIGSIDVDLKIQLSGGSCRELVKKFRNKTTKQVVIKSIKECPESGFATAIGLGAGYAYVKIVHIVNATVPLYLSYDFNRTFALYVAPKYIFQHDLEGGGTFHVVGSTVGSKIGDKTGVFLEFGYFVALSPRYPNYQANFGYFF